MGKEGAREITIPRVSILVLNWNGREILGDCLSSIERQKGAVSFECVLIDNCSSDDSVGYVQENFSWVRIVRNERDSGYAGGYNLGTSEAKGEFIFIITPDAEAGKSCILPLISALENGADIAAPVIMMKDEPESINAFGNEIHITGLTSCGRIYEKRTKDLKKERVAGFSGTSFMMRKETFERLGGFDESFFMYSEDTDLSWRMNLIGGRIMVVPEAVVYHKYVLKLRPGIFVANERNRIVMILKNYSVKSLVVFLPSFLLTEALTHAYAAYLGPEYLLGMLGRDVQAILGLGRILERRRAVQSLREVGDREVIRLFSVGIPMYKAPGFSKFLKPIINAFFWINRRVALAFL